MFWKATTKPWGWHGTQQEHTLFYKKAQEEKESRRQSLMQKLLWFRIPYSIFHNVKKYKYKYSSSNDKKTACLIVLIKKNTIKR